MNASLSENPPIKGHGQGSLIFISYQTTDANTARRIAQELLARGLNVWFAEYDVPLKSYDCDADIIKTIEEAATAANYAVVLTNERWASSSYCMKEMDSFRLEPDRIIEICIPFEQKPRDVHPILKTVSEIGNRFDLAKDYSEAVRFITTQLDLPTTDLNTPVKSSSAALLDWGVSVDFGAAGFDVQSIRYVNPDGLTDSIKTFPGDSFQILLKDGRVDLEALVTVNPFFSILKSHPLHQRSESSEYIVQKSLFEIAKRYMDSPFRSFFGAHLVFWRETSHLGLSFVENDSGKMFWHRLYALRIISENGIESGELDLRFRTDNPISYPEFWALSSRLDHVISSISYKPESLFRRSGIYFLIAKLNFLALIIAVLLDTGPAARLSALPPVKEILFSISGFVLADIICTLFSRRSRHAALARGVRWGRRLSRLVYCYQEAVLQLPILIWHAVKSPLILLGIVCGALVADLPFFYWGVLGLLAGWTSNQAVTFRNWYNLPAVNKLAQPKAGCPIFRGTRNLSRLDLNHDRIIRLLAACRGTERNRADAFTFATRRLLILSLLSFAIFGGKTALALLVFSLLPMVVLLAQSMTSRVSRETEHRISAFAADENAGNARQIAEELSSRKGEGLNRLKRKMEAIQWYAWAYELNPADSDSLVRIAALAKSLHKEKNQLLWPKSDQMLLLDAISVLRDPDAGSR